MAENCRHEVVVRSVWTVFPDRQTAIVANVVVPPSFERQRYALHRLRILCLIAVLTHPSCLMMHAQSFAAIAVHERRVVSNHNLAKEVEPQMLLLPGGSSDDLCS